MITYFLTKGDTKIAVGNTQPVYDPTKNGWVTAVGIFSTANRNDYTVSAQADKVVVKPSTPNQTVVKSVVVTPTQFLALWSSAELAVIATVRKTNAEIDQFFTTTAATPSIDLTVGNTRLSILKTIAANTAIPEVQRATRFKQIISGTPA
jgi:hypothetical protein